MSESTETRRKRAKYRRYSLTQITLRVYRRSHGIMRIELNFKDEKTGKTLSIVTDSTEAALELQRQWFSGEELSTPGKAGVAAPRLSEGAAFMLQAIEASAKEGGISSAELANILGIDPKGLGPLVGEITRWALSRGLERKDLFGKIRRRNVNGEQERIYKPGDLVREGEISFLDDEDYEQFGTDE